MAATIATSRLESQREKISSDNIFFIELGFGNDSHGQVGESFFITGCFSTSGLEIIVQNISFFRSMVVQSSTKAAIRACRNAIEFNSIPSIKRLIPEVRNKSNPNIAYIQKSPNVNPHW